MNRVWFITGVATPAEEQLTVTTDAYLNRAGNALGTFVRKLSFVQWRFIFQTQGTTDWFWHNWPACV